MPSLEEMLDVDARPVREQHKRQGFDDTVWFRLNIGRRHNADPRWILPLLCRRGHITKNEVGAIKIAANETLFDIPRGIASRFADALKRTASDDDDGVVIEPFNGNPREAARENRRKGPPPRRDHAPRGQGAPRGHSPPRDDHAPRPYRGKPKGRR
jgi:ATP-dependent RNA helicase DeaD